MAGGSKTAVYTAIAANSVVMVAKFAGFALTGSGSMFSEGVHSLADVGNQTLLAIGLKRAELPPDERHPFGYRREAPIWALISAVGIFFLGCGFTVYHSFHAFLHPEPMASPGVAFWVLVFAFVVEGAALSIAVRALTKEAAKDGNSLWAYLQEGDDPMGAAVLAEDSAAVFGVFLAMVGIGLAQWTGDPRWDAAGSLLIGLLLGGIAIYLIRMNRSLLIGKAPPPQVSERLREVLANDPVVESLSTFKTVVFGSDAVRLSAEVEFHGEAIAARHLAGHYDIEQTWDGLETAKDLEDLLLKFGDGVVEALGDEVDRLEQRLREADPDARLVDLEVN